MLDQRMLDWAPAVDFSVQVKSFGKHGPCIVPTSTFGSRLGGRPDTPADELPFVPAKFVSGEQSTLAVPPAVKAWRLRHADAKIRKEAKVSRFASSNGTSGALHAARLPSNMPCEDEWDARTSADGLVYAGIYDGHAGAATAKSLKTSLIPYVSRELDRLGRDDASPDKIDDAVKTAFVKLDDAILDAGKAALLNAAAAAPCDSGTMSALAPATAGSCALLSIFDPKSSTLRVANVSDSRAVLGSYQGDDDTTRGEQDSTGTYAAKALSEDQTAENKDEVARIKAAHPGESDEELFAWGRFLGIMVTRAFGDHRWKWDASLVERAYREFLGHQPKPGILSPPYLTAEPVVTRTSVASARDFVILASDGFWDHVAADDAVRLVAQWLEKKRQGPPGSKKTDKNAMGEENGDGAALDLDYDEQGFAGWKTLPQHFIVEDMDNAAVHLLKNALGGNRRNLFVASTMMELPLSRNIRDDIAVQVLFFQEDSI